MIRGRVSAVDAQGVYVRTFRFGLSGPLPWIGTRPAVGASVVLADCGGAGMPDLIVVGSTPGGLPVASTDNAVARFDGTGGALQDSGATVDDNANMSMPGDLSLTHESGSGRSASVSADASRNADLHLQTQGSSRWTLRKSSDTESGSDAGSNLALVRRSDAGAQLSLPIVVWRASGRVTLGDVGASAGLEFGSSGPRIMAGAGSPESVVSAPVGSLWLRTDGGAGTTLWVKESGAGNTGWVGK